MNSPDLNPHDSKTEYERRREHMMEHEADDLGFRMHRQPGTAKNWGVLAVMVLAALAIPLFYIGFGLLSGVASTRGGFVITVAFLVLLVAAAIGALYIVMRRSGQFQNTPEERGEISDMMQSSENPTVNAPTGHLVEDVMVQHPVAAGHLDNLIDVSAVMYKYNVGCIPVTDDKNVCLGMITDRDIVCGALAHGMDPASTPVTLIMERNFKSVRANQPISEVIQLMTEHSIRRVPVLEGTRCIGMVSIDDLIARRFITLDEASGMFARQLSEPNPRHGVSSTEDRVA